MIPSIGAIKQLALVETYLDADGTTKVADSFLFSPSFGAVAYDTVDFGFPDVRSTVQDLPGADGTYDETRFTGARLVTITGKALQNAFGTDPMTGGWDSSIGWNSASWWCTYLSGWAWPARRSRLYFTDDSGQARFLDVRGEAFAAAIERGSHAYRGFTLGLVCPSGKVYSFDTTDPATGAATVDGRSRVLIRQTSLDLPGRVYPVGGRTYPRYYPQVTGQTSIAYGGTVANGFTANIYVGQTPMTGARVAVTAPDGTVQSVGLRSDYAIPAGAVVTIDTTARTVVATLADGSTVSLDQYKTAPLQWPVLKPGLIAGRARGVNAIGFTIADGASDAYLEVLYRNADLL